MPLTKRTLSHTLAYASPSLYQSSPNDQVLKNTNMAAMSGSLTQLGFLASYATEMFQELFEVAEGLGKRVASVKERTERLVVDAKNMENEIALSHVNNNSAPDGATGQLNVEHSLICQLFVPDTLPAALKSRYDSADVINAPDFTEVDEAMTEEEKKKQNFLPCGQVSEGRLFCCLKKLVVSEAHHRIGNVSYLVHSNLFLFLCRNSPTLGTFWTSGGRRRRLAWQSQRRLVASRKPSESRESSA